MRMYDVIVAGGGVAGVTAAVAAARNGARTLLVERHNALGGTMTVASVGPMMTFHDALGRQCIKGLAQEVVDRLMAIAASPGHVLDNTAYCYSVTPFDTEALKLVAQRMVLEAGAEILYQTYISDAIVEGQMVEGIVVENKGGRQLLGARVVIDSTGDADVAMRAGAECMFGRPGDGLTQPASLMFRIGGVDLARLKAFSRERPELFHWGPEGAAFYAGKPLSVVAGFEPLIGAARASGELNVEREHVLFFPTDRPDEAFVNISRVTRLNFVDPWQLSQAEIIVREQIWQITAFLRKHVPGLENAHIITSGAQIGIRESRRIVGEYVLTGEDCLGALKFADVVARNAYPVDIHQPNGVGGDNRFLKPGEWYTIPFRCFVPKVMDGLLANGRCLSTDHVAHASTRTSPTCMAMGQAAGTAAAIAVRQDVPLRKVDVAELQATLKAQGADLG
jgi:hypothetical protein